jgi:hypothetical protein
MEVFAMARRGKEQAGARLGFRGLSELMTRYGCGPIRFTGTHEALYERHRTRDRTIHGYATDIWGARPCPVT